ncbi:MAG: hypothetical protein KTR24_12280, partial [Saprospiraceae bacterium]|nr:hypothetical protein [Saprospiraceae bacterium]
MRKLYFAFLAFTMMSGALMAQGPTFVLSNTSGAPGSVVSVDFSVRDFNSLVGMQFSINWDETVLSFRELKNVSGSLRDFDAGAFNLDSRFTEDGIIIVSWFDQSAEGNSLDNGTILFTVDFDVVGGAGSGTNVTISGEPRRIEVIDEGENNVGLSVEGGQFGTGGGGGNGSLRLIGSDETGQMGETVCIDVSVDGFTDVTGMQMSLNWDQTFLEFVGVGAFNLSGLNDGSFTLDDTGNGKLALQWLDPSSNGITLGTGTDIFEVCFRIIGSSGSRTVQFSNDPTPIEVIDNQDNRISFTKKDGTVTIGNGGGGTGRECEVTGFAMVASEEAPDPGSEVCVDISVKGFTDMLTMEGTIEWDNTVLSNPELRNFDLPDLSNGTFNLDQGAAGRISFAWFDMTTDGRTVPDDQVIFQLCFNVIGDRGSSTTIAFTDGLTTRGASTTTTSLDFGQCDGIVEVGGSTGGNVSANISAPTCDGDTDGSIDITVSGGNGPFTYAWSQDGNQISNSEDLENIAAGVYRLVVTDTDGTEIENRDITVNDPMNIVITDAQVTDATDGNENGSVNITVTGTGLQYSWSNGDMTEDLNNVFGGTYTVTITNADGCEIMETYTVGGEGGDFDVDLDVADLNGVGVSCNGECDGSATVSISGGSAPYTITWSTGETSASVTGLCAGEVSVTVTDSDGNSASLTQNVIEPEVLTVLMSSTPAPNNVEGTALAEVSG